jgi:hypothetical protein
MLLQYHFAHPFHVTVNDTSSGLSIAHQVALDYAIMKGKMFAFVQPLKW